MRRTRPEPGFRRFLNFRPEPPQSPGVCLFFSETFEDAPDARRVRCLNSVPRRMSGAHAHHRAGPHMSRPGGEPAQCVHRAVVGSRGAGVVTCVPAGGDVASSVRFARFACMSCTDALRGNRTLIRQDFEHERGGMPQFRRRDRSESGECVQLFRHASKPKPISLLAVAQVRHASAAANKLWCVQ